MVGAEIEPPGERREGRKQSAAKRSSASSSGCAWVPRVARRSRRHVWVRMKSFLNEDAKEKESKLEIYIPDGPRLGDKVIIAEGVSKGYGDRLLYENLSFELPPNGIVGVIGPNGAGKTTPVSHDYGPRKARCRQIHRW
jgi:sulfate-transporting ATPase